MSIVVNVTEEPPNDHFRERFKMTTSPTTHSLQLGDISNLMNSFEVSNIVLNDADYTFSGFHGVAIWLEFDCEIVSNLISSLLNRLNLPVFPPHCTVLYGLDSSSVQDWQEKLESLKFCQPFKLKFTELEYGDYVPFEMKYLELNLDKYQNPTFYPFYKEVCDLFDVGNFEQRWENFFPHVSLTYADSRSTILNSSLGYHLLQTSPELLSHSIYANKLSAWVLDGSVREWHCIARVNLFED